MHTAHLTRCSTCPDMVTQSLKNAVALQGWTGKTKALGVSLITWRWACNEGLHSPVVTQCCVVISLMRHASCFFFLSISQKKRPHTSRCLNVEEKIQINKEVSNIDWSRSADESVTVKCSDGSTYNADHVIVSVPLGVLKHNYTTLFTPPLPKIKKNAIQGISFGTVGKIYLEFEMPWWPNDWVGLSLLWTKEDIEKIKSTENYWFVMLMKMSAGWEV